MSDRFVIGNDGTSIRDTRLGETVADARAEDYAALICEALNEWHRRRDETDVGYDPNEGMALGRQSKISGMEPRSIKAKVRKPKRDPWLDATDEERAAINARHVAHFTRRT